MSVFDNYSNNLPGDRKKRILDLDKNDYQYFAEGEDESISKPQKNFLAFYISAILIALVLIIQLLNLQITHGSFNRVLAEGNRIRQRQIPAPRGLIYDRNGQVLVINDVSYCLAIYPLDLPKNEKDRIEFYQKVSSATQISVEEITSAVRAKGLSQADPIILKENIDRDAALLLQVRTINLPGVSIEKRPKRNYVSTFGISQILGYVGKVSDQDKQKNPQLQLNEWLGKDGLEKTYQEFLKGNDGINEIEVDSRGRAQRILSNLAPTPGDNLTLTIDNNFENFMAKTLEEELAAVSANTGAVVALNPKTGEVLGMVSLPGFDNNLFAKGISTDDFQNLINNPLKPMFNRSVAGTYPSGSVIKPLVASAALQENVITPNTTINDSEGKIEVNNYVYPDWKIHGLTDVRKAIAESCNVFFYALGGGWDKIKGLGVDKLHDYLTKFGLGKALGIDLPSEANGLVPSPDWKKKAKNESWYLGDTYHMAIGQGDVLVTPLQMANATAAIANGGELLKPYVVSRVKNIDGQLIKENKKTILNKDFIAKENIDVVKEGMRQAVTSGSARQFNDLSIQVAAKTGTAQFGDKDKTHAWMTAFAPYDDPQITIAVIIEGGGEGYAAAGPVVKKSLDWYFNR